MKTKILPSGELISAAAQEIAELVKSKPVAAIAFSDDPEVAGILSTFFLLCKENQINCSGLRFFATSNIPQDPAAEAVLKNGFDVIRPDPENPEAYDGLISECGVDLQLLSVGCTGRIAYNEPAVPYNSVTHIQKLTDRTKKELLEKFERTSVPDTVCTAGIHTILSAAHILVACSGEYRAEALFRTLYARTDSVVPSAFLQLHLDVTIYADALAAEKL
ncbi:MAG: hypothetical protein MJ135_01290 [Oscillospiraceae bacterium]|nr:hypothetical protein [Oscillospiraceae bacterium]